MTKATITSQDLALQNMFKLNSKANRGAKNSNELFRIELKLDSTANEFGSSLELELCLGFQTNSKTGASLILVSNELKPEQRLSFELSAL